MPRKWCEQGCSLRDVELGDKGDPVPRRLATGCSTRHWPQSSLTVPGKVRHKPGQCPAEGVEMGANGVRDKAVAWHPRPTPGQAPRAPGRAEV